MTRTGLVVATLTLMLLMTPAWAADGEKRVQFGALYSSPTDDLTEDGTTTEADAALGFQASFEIMVNDKIGIEPGIQVANHDVDFEDVLGESDLGDIDFTAVMATVNFHVLQRDNIDLYVGPTVGYVFWGDLTTDVFGPPETFSADDEVAYGANVGLDIPFGEGNWEFSAGLTYLFVEVSLDGGPALGVDPIQGRAGVSYKF